MVGKVISGILKVDDVNLEEIFEKYCDECENKFDIEAFKAPSNILKSGDLEENQYNSQFINPNLKNTLKAICNMDWRILEVPIRSSKYRRNSNINAFIDKVLSAKRVAETFVYEQTGPPDVDDVTDFTSMIINCNNLASFGALGHRDEVSLLWCTIHLRPYCLREYGSFRVPTIWQDLPVLSEAIIACLKFL
ncbi:hypothetical protein C1645_824400 [Glomus cerebriforme]|uniref:Uncharacterized protein n=1 Tax=Glomus cerebriforme TaxID=658196 RepID=A0A397SVQ6_9GLOM|nr:hypothetical protein C1645_824400 [Glomus cerebriforme]